jgi:cytochrome P450
VLRDPYPAYRPLLTEGRVHYCARRHCWALSSYEHVRAAGRAHDGLSSAEGVTRLRSRFPMLLTVDRPDHTRLRRVLARDFSGDVVEQQRPAVEALAREAVDALLAVKEADAVEVLAAPVPTLTIAALLGIPGADRDRFRRWSARATEGFGLEIGPRLPRSLGRSLTAVLRLRAYFAAQIDDRRRNPGEDLLSRLVAGNEDGRLDDDELFWFALLLLLAGNETTSNLLGTMLLALAEHPEQYARLREDRSLIPAAVEEALRHCSPIQGLYRTALADYRVGDATIPRGARVLLLFGAANRDPRRFEDPDRFDVTRQAGEHLAFGSGIHFCLGARLARLEAQVVLQELTSRVGSITLAGSAEWGDNPSLRGLARLPVRVRAA